MAEDRSRNMQEMSEINSVRLRPQNTFGTNDEFGEAHGIYEIVANAVDEGREGYGRVADVTIREDGSVVVIDEGRGIPMEWNEDLDKYNWETAFCKLNGSGKFDSAQYNKALGTNGLGLTAMNYASAYMKATSYYGGKKHYIEFEKGVPVGDMVETADDSGRTGTIIEFLPDTLVFKGKTGPVPLEYFTNLARRQAMLLPGFKFIFKHPSYSRQVVICFEGGIKEYASNISGNRICKEVMEYSLSTEGTDDPVADPEKYRLDMQLDFIFSKDQGGVFEIYHNGSLMFEKSQNKTSDAVQRAFVKSFEEYGKKNGKLSKNDKLMFRDIENILICVATTDAPGYRTFFMHQTKGAVNNPFIVKSLNEFAYQSIKSWLENSNDSKKVYDIVLANKRAREEADKISKRAVAELSKPNTLSDKQKGLAECLCKDPKQCEIYIVEGESAGGATIVARNKNYQAIIAAVGKPINCCKNPMSSVIDNSVIKSIYRALGCGISKKSKYIKNIPPFDINKLRYDKIILAADGDIDGGHIVILFLAMFYTLSPELLKEGKVYIVESPLFEIVTDKETFFAYSDEERDIILKALEDRGVKGNKITINRSKGLGENDQEMMEITTMNPETRRLIQVEYPTEQEEIELLTALFDTVLGNDLEGRRILIDEYFSRLEVDID